VISASQAVIDAGKNSLSTAAIKTLPPAPWTGEPPRTGDS
jgi:hypothetical protein